MLGDRRPLGTALRARPGHHGLCSRHAHESRHADRARPGAHDRFSSAKCRSSRLCQRIQADDREHPLRQNRPADDTDLRLPWRERTAVLPPVPRAGRPHHLGHGLAPSQLNFGLPELADDRLRSRLLSSWHLLPSFRLHHPEILSLKVATFKEGRSVDYHAEAGRRLRTTNGVERLNKEIKRRTRVATLFPNEASLLRLVPAVLSKISDDWETARSYLAMGSDDEP